ncbi:carboxylesterase family protein [Modestobacter altitudinis]|uniref:carboxylesterase family protein n=1 Tax=Modestobacter altitudinis TaxID=2213158 RepID=UPI00110CA13C|nr:carboxylesterase family protein [Modestobacter altitudinis]
MSLVPTGSGPVVGRVAGTVRSWRGIAYATAERFGPAGPAPSWAGTRDATAPGPVGVQWTPAGSLTGTEDCLTLDVYAPDDVPGPLPVLFWVHGGAFQTGAAADYDGSVLAAAGPAVVVAVSYRLGPFGFLQLGTAEAPDPSPALTDLLAALDWVGREIAAFGGDPDRITLVGQSAGASLVCALLATSAGQRARAAVAFSVGGPVLEPAEAVDVAARTLHQLGVPRTDLAALRTLPAEAVMAAAATVARESRRQRLGGVVWGPVLDGTVLAVQPAVAVATGALRDTALWFGSCRDEMTMFLQHGSGDAVAVARARVGGARFDRLHAVYAATARPGEDPVQALLTDEMWVQPVWELAQAQVSAGGRAWVSRWDHSPGLPPYDRLGPTHGADNACLWAHPPRFVERPLLARPAADMTDADQAVTAVLHDAVLGMVRAGTPATGELVDWVPYEPAARCTAVFDATSRVESDPAGQRRRAWDTST